jgi:hypothetical protein
MIEDEIERLIAMLDEADPDPDLEIEHEGAADVEAWELELYGEPSLASPECHPAPLYGYHYAGSVAAGVQGGDQSSWTNGGRDDVEFDDCDLEHGGDDEASLGWTVAMKQDGPKWLASSFHVDAEAEHDGREPDADLELEPDDETGSDGDASDAERNPAYAERLRHRRRSSGGGDRPMRVKEFLDVMDRLSPAEKAAVAGRLKQEVRS